MADPALFEVDSYIPNRIYTNYPMATSWTRIIGYGWGATLSIPILNNYSGQSQCRKS